MATASDTPFLREAEQPRLARRGFLRGLVSLPLIGSGVTLIGQPTAAAVPMNKALMTRYVAWLAREHAEALVEYEDYRGISEPEPYRRAQREFRREWVQQPLFWFPDDPVADAAVRGAPPSTRAAVVLSAVGCDWRREG